MIPFLHESRFVLKINVLIHSAKGINLKHIPVTFIYTVATDMGIYSIVIYKAQYFI